MCSIDKHCDESTEDVGFVLGEDEIIMQPLLSCGWAFMQLWLQSLSSRLQAEATQPESPPAGPSCQIMDAIKC